MSGNTLEALSSLLPGRCEGGGGGGVGAIITSLTSCATTKHNSQSLSEALATSVADYVCAKQRRIKSNNDGSDASSSFIKNENATITDVVMEMAELTPRLVSGGEGENNLMILPPASDGGERIISDSTVSNRDSPDSMDALTSPTTTRTTYNRSSMSDDIADLANGMCNFFGSGKSGNNCGDSAPIISGTAAEVLALQHSASAIISCNSMVQCSTSCSTSSSRRRQQYTAEQRKMMIAAAASVITANNNAASNVSPLKHTTTTAADGSPIIDGTDSAKAISIGGGNCDGHHGPDESNFLTVTPEDHQCPSTTHEFYSLVCSSQVKSSTTTTTATGSSSLGGMDILAEITCHAPPLPLPPTTVSHHTTTTTTTNIHSYNQQQQQQHAIPSYQEILSEEQQQNSHHVRQALQHDLFKDEKRVLAIPSYQEIYRELGLSPGERHTHDLNCDSYSTIEEMQQVDPNNHSYFYDSSYNNNPYNQSHNQYYINSDDPTRMICRTPTAHFGHVNRDDIDEGKELYSRKDVALLGGHVSEVKDVIGSMKDGCSSLVLGNMEKDLRECDGLLWFLYSTDRANGGGALFRSYHNKLPIRIFRSSLLGGKYAPPFLGVEDDLEEDSDVAYRYDGLYMVRAVWDIHGHETETYPVTGENGWQTYFCTRLPRRPLEEEKREEGMEYNAMGCQELWSTIQKMRGVRKPKKFDIPPPPVKLGPLRKCAISGAYKDRKAVGFVKPTGETQLFVAPPRQRRPKSKSPRAIPMEENDEDDDDNESKSNIVCLQQQQHQTNQLSSSSSLKVMTQRPRLNSTMSFESKNASPSPRHVDAESDDSESSSSASQVNANQNKRRKTTPNPKYSKDNAVYISKRTTVAKAEAANKVMFGGSKCLKRKSSDSVNYTVSATKGRCAVEESIITDGSRILVAHKGALYKATIRRRREKDGRHDFLIHYDGNKKSNTHWIGVDDIHKILEINVDTPPKKLNFTASGGVGIKTAVNGKDKRCVGKRKSPVPTEEFDSDDNMKNPQCVLPDNKSIPAVDDSELDCQVVTISPLNAVAARKPRETVVSHVCKVESPRKKSSVKSIADMRGTTDSDNDDGSESDDDGNAKAKSKPTIPSKYPVGDHVYVEYRQIFYSSTILNIRRKRGGAGGSNIEYLVHYEGYKKSSNTWVKEATLHEVNAKTTKRFEAQRITPADKLPESEQQSSESCKAPRKRKGLFVDTESTSLDNQPALQKKPPTPKLRSDESDSVLKSIKSGVDFLVGSMVFVEWTGALFLAKMLKKRYSGDHAEYLISYDGYNSNHDAWVTIHKIYEVNPQTKRVYKKLNIDMSVDGGKQKKPGPLPERRETRKKAQDDDGATREDEGNSQSPSHISSRATAKVARAVSSLSSDMKGIDSGVEFLPGSTIFAEYKGGLCLAKMMKKRGKGDYTEYLIEYNGLQKSVEAWVSTALIYEINPQTKRMFRELSVTK